MNILQEGSHRIFRNTIQPTEIRKDQIKRLRYKNVVQFAKGKLSCLHNTWKKAAIYFLYGNIYHLSGCIRCDYMMASIRQPDSILSGPTVYLQHAKAGSVQFLPKKMMHALPLQPADR